MNLRLTLPRTVDDTAGSYLYGWRTQSNTSQLYVRGGGWDFGRDIFVPPYTRPSQRNVFLRATALSVVRSFVLLDFYYSCIRLIPGAGTLTGGTIFPEHLSPLQRYAVSTGVHFAMGMLIMYGVGLVHDFNTMLAVGLLGHPPSAWPPVHDSPWKARSLHEFWAKRWHQGLRRVFVVTGGSVGTWIAGNAGMVIGTFLVSGLFHELSMYSFGRGLDHCTTLWFTLQGFGIVLEKVWKMLTSRKVGGVWGRLCTVLFVIVFGQMFRSDE
ncbi:hypothetical protein SCP_0104160 [Sparassis crispa]|uniref:Wax synthase domain-containing protein n=1 Tax=Sparassis crispa TaxID=139825 RepID=A0A401G5V9_9APHY|nr:hypothetical protein SCP_0104160 [Sparassis crispa]GBE77539.1 hypothetical protein SCP_0104160 [Sparassis crispa]